MADYRCPYCGSQSFHLRDPQDQYEIYEFDLRHGKAFFIPSEEGNAQPPDITDDTETYCNLCSWHSKFNALKRLG